MIQVPENPGDEIKTPTDAPSWCFRADLLMTSSYGMEA